MTDTVVRERAPRDPDRSRSTKGESPTGAGLFRAMWRWHFFAAFLVAPILLVLASTGLIYLFRFQLEPLLHADLMKVEAPSATAIMQPAAAQLSNHSIGVRPNSSSLSSATTRQAAAASFC